MICFRKRWSGIAPYKCQKVGEKHNIINSRQTDFSFGVDAGPDPGNRWSPVPLLSVRSSPHDVCHGWDLSWWLLTYIRSLLYLFYTLIKLYYIKSSEQSSLITGPGSNSFPPEAKNPGIWHSSSQQHFNTEEILQELRVF